MNRYNYVNNDPLNATDPSGEQSCTTVTCFILNGQAGLSGQKKYLTGTSATMALKGGGGATVILGGAAGAGIACAYGGCAAAGAGANTLMLNIAVRAPMAAPLGAGAANIANGVANPGSQTVATAIPTISVSASRFGQTAQHIIDTQKAGQPNVLTIAREGASANRAASLAGIPRVAGRQLDEYPPAMFSEGGAGASVRAVDGASNMGVGASIGNQCRSLPCGTKVLIEVTD